MSDKRLTRVSDDQRDKDDQTLSLQSIDVGKLKQTLAISTKYLELAAIQVEMLQIEISLQTDGYDERVAGVQSVLTELRSNAAALLKKSETGLANLDKRYTTIEPYTT